MPPEICPTPPYIDEIPSFTQTSKKELGNHRNGELNFPKVEMPDPISNPTPKNPSPENKDDSTLSVVQVIRQFHQ